MIGAPTPIVSLLINGVDVGASFAPELLDFTWTDNLSGKADEIAVKLADPSGKWRGAWRPELGDIVKAAIGYEGQGLMDCGQFQVDIPKASGSRANEVLNFKATSAFPDTDQRTQKSKGFEKTSLKKLAAEIAGRHGYGLSGEIDDVSFEYKRQRRERDLAFLRRLAEDYGHFVAIKDKKLVFYRRDDLEKRGPVRAFNIAAPTSLIQWSAEDKSHQSYKRAKAQYLDPATQELLTAEASDPNAKSEDILKIDERVESAGQAQKLAESRLAKANEDNRTASLTIVGDPIMIAGQVVKLGGTFGQYAGRYLVHTATHQVRRAQYTTKLELKGV